MIRHVAKVLTVDVLMQDYLNGMDAEQTGSSSSHILGRQNDFRPFL
jgi:hypothetical protein